MNFIRSFQGAAMAALLCTTACSNEPATPATLFIFADLSASAPMSTDKAFARRAASEAASLIGKMRLGDKVIVQSLGDHTSRGRQRREFPLTPQTRQRLVAAQVASLIATAPDSDLAGQDETALTFGIEQSGIACHGKDQVVLFTDGMESSRGFDRMDQVIAGKTQLPAPPKGVLRGCKASMLGIGIQADGRRQLNNAELHNLSAAWREYFHQAGLTDEDIRLAPLF